MPDEIKNLVGSKKPRNQNSPKFRSAESLKPLKSVERDAYALEEWHTTIDELIANGLLTRASVRVFGNYCLAVAASEHAEDDIQERGRLIDVPVYNKKGDLVGSRQEPNPFLAIAQKARLETLRYAAELGMTPAAATRVQAAPKEGKHDAFSQFMSAESTPEDEDAARTN